jgi:tetratricopeptide (TPR) repeat protein
MQRGRPVERASRRTAATCCLAVAALALAAYANTLANGFVWDDPIILERQLAVFDSPSAVLVVPRGIPQYSPDYYRPLTIASYLLDRTVAGWLATSLGAGEALAFHLSVVLAHALASVLVCLLALRLLGDERPAVAGALAAAASFAVHPVHTESVAWMAGRADVLATCSCLAALIVHRGRATTWARSAVTGLLVACALGAKEVGAAVLLLLPLRDVLLRPAATKGRKARERDGSGAAWIEAYVGPAAALLLYLVLRRASIGEIVGTAPGEAGMVASLDRVAGAFGAYLAKLVWPIELNAYIDAVSTSAAVLVLSVAAALAAAAAIAASILARDRLPAFCLIWVLLTLVPSLSIVWKIPDAPMAERYLYLPSAGFCLLLGWLFREAWRRSAPAGRWAIAAATALLVTAATFLTVERNRVWQSDLSLWQDTSRKSVSSAMPLRSLATAYQRAGDAEQARRWFEKALERPNTALGQVIIHNNLGTLAMSARDFAAAEQHYRRALAVGKSADASFNLALALLEKGNWDADAVSAAMPHLAEARAQSPYDPDVLAVLGKVQAIRGERAAAIESLERSLELGLNPVSAEGARKLLARLRGES